MLGYSEELFCDCDTVSYIFVARSLMIIIVSLFSFQLLWSCSHSFGKLGTIPRIRTAARECMVMKWHFGKGASMQELGIIGRLMLLNYNIDTS